MSGAVTAAVVVGAAAIGSAVYSGEQQKKAANKQKKAQEEATRQAEKQAEQQMRRQEEQMAQQERQMVQSERRVQEQQAKAEQQTNRARRGNRANAGAAVDGSLASLDGPGSTLLTGAQGVSPDQLQLGKNTLLGG